MIYVLTYTTTNSFIVKPKFFGTSSYFPPHDMFFFVNIKTRSEVDVVKLSLAFLPRDK